MRPSLAIPPGGSCRLSIAGLGVEILAKHTLRSTFELPGEFASFETRRATADVSLVLDSRPGIRTTNSPVLHDSGLNWLIRGVDSRIDFESYHLHHGLLVSADTRDFRRYRVLFHEENWERIRTLAGAPRLHFQLPFPLHQLLMLAPLAHQSGFLLHASGAVIGGKAFVFAGHSGDGKTTLSRLLASEGIELLSDERIALRKEADGFRAYGTPWPGEGEIVSPASYPLGGVFILRKSDRHRIREGRPSFLAAELLSRAIVPYYFGPETQTILGLVHDLAVAAHLRELEFSLTDGLLPILAQAA